MTCDISHKERYVPFIILELVCGYASFQLSSNWRWGYYILGTVFFIPVTYSLVGKTYNRFKSYPEKCQYWLKYSCFIFFGFWPLFPIRKYMLFDSVDRKYIF